MKYSIILVICCLFLLPQLFLNAGGRFYDAPRYICLGYSIANGNGYRFIFDPNNKPCFYNNFLYPYIIAPIIKLKGIDFFSLKLAMILFSFITVILFTKWTKFFWNEKMSGYFALLLVSAPIFIEFSDKIMTEIPFLLFTLSSFILFENWNKIRKNIYLFILAITLYCLIFTRIPGITYLMAGIVYSITKREKKLLAIGMMVLLFTIITIGVIQSKVYPEDRFYHVKYMLYKNPFNPEAGFVNLGNIIERGIQNLKFYLLKLGETCIQFPYKYKPAWFSLFTLMIIFWGIIKSSFRTRAFYLPTILLYLGHLLIWPWQDVRFILPIYPLILVLFFSGLKGLLKKFNSKWETRLLTVILVLNLYGGYEKLITKLTIESIHPPQLKEFIEMGNWMKKNLENDAVVLSSNPSLIYLLSFKKGVFLIYTADIEKITTYVKNKHVNYILADTYNSEMRRYIYPWIYKNKDRLRIRKINGATVLFKID